MNIVGVLRVSLDNVNAALAKGDMETVKDTVQSMAKGLKQMLPRMVMGQTGQFLQKIMGKMGQLAEGMAPPRKGNSEVETLANDLKK